jgi:hypothetical protein
LCETNVIYKQSNKQIFFVSIFVFFLTSLYSIPYNVLAQQTTENFLTYTNVDYGFTIKYPSNWVVNDNNFSAFGVKFISPDSPHAVVGVHITNIPPNETGMLLENAKVEAMHLHLRILEINNETYFLSGYPAIRMVGMMPNDIKITILLSNIGSKIYAVDYISIAEIYSNYLSVAQEMIDSFQAIDRQ